MASGLVDNSQSNRFYDARTRRTKINVGGVARLYAVDYGRTQERYNTVDGRTLNVVPRLPPIKTRAVTLSLMVLRSYYQRESHLTGWLLYVAHHVPKTKSLQPKSS